MRIEIDTRDLVVLVQQFLTKPMPEEDLLADIEEMVTYASDYSFDYEVEIAEL
jgi:hypothetical protein